MSLTSLYPIPGLLINYQLPTNKNLIQNPPWLSTQGAVPSLRTAAKASSVACKATTSVSCEDLGIQRNAMGIQRGMMLQVWNDGISTRSFIGWIYPPPRMPVANEGL